MSPCEIELRCREQTGRTLLDKLQEQRDELKFIGYESNNVIKIPTNTIIHHPFAPNVQDPELGVGRHWSRAIL
jgi:hypothetical protein